MLGNGVPQNCWVGRRPLGQRTSLVFNQGRSKTQHVFPCNKLDKCQIERLPVPPSVRSANKSVAHPTAQAFPL